MTAPGPFTAAEKQGTEKVLLRWTASKQPEQIHEAKSHSGGNVRYERAPPAKLNKNVQHTKRRSLWATRKPGNPAAKSCQG